MRHDEGRRPGTRRTLPGPEPESLLLAPNAPWLDQYRGGTTSAWAVWIRSTTGTKADLNSDTFCLHDLIAREIIGLSLFQEKVEIKLSGLVSKDSPFAGSIGVTITIANAIPSVMGEAPQFEVERRYAMREVKQRLHQASFREAILTAYRGRCAISGLPARQLLDAAHIIPDALAEYGAPLIRRGLALSKVHHSAFDGCLIGIDPDYTIHVSEKLLDPPR